MAKIDAIFEQYAKDPDTYRGELWVESLIHLKRSIKWDHEYRDDIAMDVVMETMESLSDYDATRASFGTWLAYRAKSAEKESNRKLIRSRKLAGQAPLPRDEDGEPTGVFGDMEALSGEAQIAGRISCTSDRDLEAFIARCRLRSLFDDDLSLVDCLLETEGNLAEVGRLTGQSRSALRHKVTKAKLRYEQEAA